MSGFSTTSELLRGGGFSVHGLLGRVTANFIVQCCTLTFISAVAVIVASFLDGTLFLGGRDVGLLEHPAIWAMLGLQIALPLSIRQSLRKLTSTQFGEAIGRAGVPTIEAQVLRSVRLQDRFGRLVAAVCYLTGLLAFVWNSYQNQQPGVVVPFDFWDSSNHAWGYWVTRIYKLYLFVWFFPYIALVHAAILAAVLRAIREERQSGALKLEPFHTDRAGGLGFVPGLVTTPIIVTLLAAAIPVAAAFEVHQSLAVSPLIGAAIVSVSALIAYAVPIFYLRTDILAMKRATVEKLRRLQQLYYAEITEGEAVDFEALRRGNEALDYFDKISDRIDGISNYPHFGRLLRFLGLALTPSIASVGFELYDKLSPFVGPLLKRP